MKPGNSKYILWACLLIFGSVYMVQVILNHYFMRTYALDYGFYNQAFWDFAHFRANRNTVFEPLLANYFQIHPAFTLPLLSPLYWIFSPVFGTYSLLIIQNIFILLGGYGTYLLVKRKSGDSLIAIFAFVHYNLLWGHFSALSSDYIDTTVAASMVPLFFLFFDKRKYGIALLFFVFVIVCKENMPIWFVFISLTLFILYNERKARIWAVLFGVFSLIYFIFLFRVLIPAFENPELPYWGFAYAALGNNPVEALRHIFQHPMDTMKLLFVNHSGDPTFDNIKIEFYQVFLISGGILLFLRPVYFIPFIPIIAQKMFNDMYNRWGIVGFYSIEVVSILTMAVFLATDRIRKPKTKYILYSVLCLVTLAVTVIKMGHRTSLYYDPGKERLTSAAFYTAKNDVRRIRQEIKASVPADANVAAMQDIVPHLAFRKNISIFPYVRDADYIIFVMNGNQYPLKGEEFLTAARKYLDNPGWFKIVDDYPLIILKRRPHLP